MIKRIMILVLLTGLSGCQKNAHLKAALNDFESTPRCDVKPVLTEPRDVKNTLKAKLLILNYKVACFRDWYIQYQEKIDSYKDL